MMFFHSNEMSDNAQKHLKLWKQWVHVHFPLSLLSAPLPPTITTQALERVRARTHTHNTHIHTWTYTRVSTQIKANCNWDQRWKEEEKKMLETSSGWRSGLEAGEYKSRKGGMRETWVTFYLPFMRKRQRGSTSHYGLIYSDNLCLSWVLFIRKSFPTKLKGFIT